MHPRILLAEDDPTSAAFLHAATAALPAEVDVAATAAAARELAHQHAYALWLIDAHLPDGSGTDLLASLRADGLTVPALAHTASHEASMHAALCAAGFADVLVKPISADDWRAALARALSGAQQDPQPAPTAGQSGDTAALRLWNDATATRALGGNPEHVHALRQLFLAELPAQVEALRSAELSIRQATLHRLRASCALVGAERLDAAVRALESDPGSEAALSELLTVAGAMHDQAPSSG